LPLGAMAQAKEHINAKQAKGEVDLIEKRGWGIPRDMQTKETVHKKVKRGIERGGLKQQLTYKGRRIWKQKGEEVWARKLALLPGRLNTTRKPACQTTPIEKLT